jgi:hypothetical protein
MQRVPTGSEVPLPVATTVPAISCPGTTADPLARSRLSDPHSAQTSTRSRTSPGATSRRSSSVKSMTASPRNRAERRVAVPIASAVT